MHTWQRNNTIAATDTTPAHTTTTMSRLDMILVTASKASMCTKAEVDWTMVDSDHAGLQIWLDISSAVVFYITLLRGL